MSPATMSPAPSDRSTRWRRPIRVLITGTALLIVALALPVGAAPIPGTPEIPRVAIVATAGNFPDALAAGPVAGALGGIVVLTSTDALAQAAEAALVSFDPDIVYIAGGPAAISAGVEAAIDAAGPWTVQRKSGPSRVETAAALATILDDLGVDRPVTVADGQVIGDVSIGGALSADDFHAHGTAPGVAVAGARIRHNDAFVLRYFNRVGGAVEASKIGTGQYSITVPGRDFADEAIVQITRGTSAAGFTSMSPTIGGGLIIHMRDTDGNFQDATFNLTVFDASPEG